MISKWRYFFEKRNPAVTSERVLHEQRQRFNPLRGFDPDRLVNAIDAFRCGSIDPLSRIIEELEERDDMMTSCARKNRASLGRCPHQVLITEGHEGNERAELHKQVLTRFWANIEVTSAFTRNERGGIRLLKQQMANAISRRFAVHEIVWQPLPDGEITARFIQVPNWFFENRSGELRFLRAPGMLDGVPMAAGEWLVTVGEGIGIAAAVLAMGKTLSRNDWLLFTERCGQPGLHVATDAAQDSPPWLSLVKAVRNFGREWSIVTDNNTKLSAIDLKTGSTLPYEPLINLCNKGIATLYRGADLATISGKDGESTGASVQGKETDLLEQDACEMLSETLNYQIERYVIRYVTGDPLPLAYLSIAPTEQPNVDQDIKIDQHLANHGVELSRNDALARYGRTAYDPETPGDAPLKPLEQPQPGAFGAFGYPNERNSGGTPPQRVANVPGNVAEISAGLADSSAADAPEAPLRASNADTLDALLEAFRADLGPVAAKVAALLALPPAERAAAAAALAAELPALVPHDPEMVAILEGALAEAFVDEIAGLENAQARCPVCEQWLNKDGTCTNCRGDGGTAGTNPDPSETQAAEIGKGKKAIEAALQNKQDVYNAISRGDIGTISFLYGTPGDPDNDYEGGSGMAHIVAKHGQEVSAKLPTVLVRGNLGAAYEQGRKRNITMGPYTAVLRLTHNDKHETWVLTAFDKKKAPAKGA